MKKFLLVWADETEATYPDITTNGREHSYAFEVESVDDAKAFARSFAMINPDHDFTSYELREIESDQSNE